MNVLQGCEPKRVFEIFEEICAIPHGSGNTKAIAEYCRQFGQRLGLPSYMDRGGNVIIKKPASPGYENAEPVILQGHFDMVAEKTPESTFDFSRDGLRLFVDGDWIGARDTTLGGDDGIAVAMSLAVLEDQSLSHPALEVLLTRDEETGMFGAIGLEGEKLQGRRLINIDSEEEGVFTVSCAGGLNVTFDISAESAPVTGEVISLTVDGLTGGHSGVEIHHGRANAYVLLGLILKELGARIVSVGGGGKPNVIARQASAVICVSSGWEAKLRQLEQNFRQQYRTTDPDLHITAAPADAAVAMSEACSSACAEMLTKIPDGVMKMSEDIDGLVQTSLNLGIMEATASHMHGIFSIRSSVARERDALAQSILSTVGQAGGTGKTAGEYPAWEYRKDSPLRELMVETFAQMYGKAPRVVAIHAGLECGLLSEKLPGLDAVSIGPDMRDIHTPQERLCISSVERVWNYLKQVLKNMK